MPQTDVLPEKTINRDDDEMWGLKSVVAKTDLSRSTLYACVSIGLFPKKRRLGVRRIAWLASEASRPPPCSTAEAATPYRQSQPAVLPMPQLSPS